MVLRFSSPPGLGLGFGFAGSATVMCETVFSLSAKDQIDQGRSPLDEHLSTLLFDPRKLVTFSCHCCRDGDIGFVLWLTG
jgi:hypothetical protein